jgi:O-methyltransferase
MKTIAVFGTGSAWHDLRAILPDHIRVVALLDNNAALHGTRVDGYEVHAPANVSALNFDKLVVAGRYADAMREEAIRLGVAANDILVYGVHHIEALSADAREQHARTSAFLEIDLLPADVVSMSIWPAKAADFPPGDWVRYSTMTLVCQDIQRRGIAGAIAELGVYQGKTAAFLNGLLPERPLYLFDTFEGFAAADVARDTQMAMSRSSTGQFADTSVATVLDRLPHRERAIVKQGYFPDSAQGVEDQFALVSLDVDLYAPTYAGLEYFYPRLTSGGYLFVHDYNNRRFEGVRRAVDDFRAAHAVAAFPLPDACGSIVICKP